MKKIMLLAAIFTTFTGIAQDRKSPHDTISTSEASITYGRPYKKGRVVFGELEKYGKVWRLGADEATTITFNKPANFGGSDVPAGTYTMFAIINENEWTIILNSVLGQWGAYSYEKNKEKNVARIKAAVKKIEPPVEQFTIRFANDGSVIFEWDKTQVRVPIKY